MSIATIYRHSPTNPVRGREVDINFDALVNHINGLADGTIKFTLTLPAYADNAAALAGGLVAGNLYRTGGDPDTVCIVH